MLLDQRIAYRLLTAPPPSVPCLAAAQARYHMRASSISQLNSPSHKETQKNAGTNKSKRNTINQHNKSTLQSGLYGDDSSPRLGFLRGVFLANHLASNDNLTRTTKRQNIYQPKLTIHKRGLNKQQYN